MPSGVAASLRNTAQQVGRSIGLALLGAIAWTGSPTASTPRPRPPAPAPRAAQPRGAQHYPRRAAADRPPTGGGRRRVLHGRTPGRAKPAASPADAGHLTPSALGTPFPPVTDGYHNAGRRSLQCPHPAAKLAIARCAEW